MRLTPLDIREQEFRRVMRGLDPDEVSTFLANVAGEFEAMVAENQELRRRVLEIEGKIHEYSNMEKALRDTLLTAERVLNESKENAQKEAVLIVQEAEVAAQRATSRISQDVLQMRQELARLRSMKDQYLSRLRLSMQAGLESLETVEREFSLVDTEFRESLSMQSPPMATHDTTRTSEGSFKLKLKSPLDPGGPPEAPQLQAHDVSPHTEKWSVPSVSAPRMAAPSSHHPPVTGVDTCDTVPEPNPDSQAAGSKPTASHF